MKQRARVRTGRWGLNFRFYREQPFEQQYLAWSFRQKTVSKRRACMILVGAAFEIDWSSRTSIWNTDSNTDNHEL